MMSDSQILRAIDEARKNGEITFLSEEPKKDRAKIYRLLDKQKEDALPLFPNEDRFEVHLPKEGGRVTLRRKSEDSLLMVATPGEIKPVEVKPKKARKKTPAIEKAEKDIENVERSIQQHLHELTPELLREHRQAIMIRRIAIEYYQDTKDEVFIPVFKCETSDWENRVQEAFNPDYMPEQEFKLLPRREQIRKRIGEIQNSSSADDQREHRLLLEELDRLILLEDKKWTDPDGLLD